LDTFINAARNVTFVIQDEIIVDNFIAISHHYLKFLESLVNECDIMFGASAK